MRLILVLGWVALACGCEAKPKAPALRQDSVYQNDDLGLRFKVPDGWKQYAASTIPPGPLTRQRLVVAYHSLKFHGALFDVTVSDLPPETDMAAVVGAGSHSVADWKPSGPPETVAVGGPPTTRYRFNGKTKTEAMTKEVVVVRRGPRVVFLTLIAPVKDTSARDEVRRCVAAITWKE